MSYKVVTDSSANLPSEKIIKYGITVVPFTYIIDGEEHTVDPFATEDAQKEFFDKMREKAEITTSLINSTRFAEYFEPILEAGEDVLYVGMSAGISGTFTNAMIAADELKEKYPDRKIELVDSKNASMGEGLLALIGARMMNKGVELEEAAERLRKTVPHLRGVFMVDDIMYLRRTGRVSGFTAVAGKTIGIRPLLKGNDEGKIVLCGTARGRKGAIEKLLSEFEEHVTQGLRQSVAVCHCDAPEDAQYVAERMAENPAVKDVSIGYYESVTGSHIGPGALAIFYLADHR